jgi:hypothetical protein
MSTIKMPEEIDHNRRRFFGTAAMTVAATQLGLFDSADAQSRKANPADVPPIKPSTNTSFAALKADRRRPLERWIRRSWPRRWPFCHSSPRLALRHLQLRRCRPFVGVAGYRVIVPYLRGCGTTRFLSSDTPAICSCSIHHRFDGCSQDPQSNHRRF